jgi:tetratricopeptide (TPR) repeat protein
MEMRAKIAVIVFMALALPMLAQAQTTGSSKDRGVEAVTLSIYPEYVNRWAILIGISKYRDERLNLKYADRDAEGLYELLQTQAGGGFEKDHILKLVNEQATTAEVMRALRTFLKKPAREDIVLVYFAAHGAPDPERPRNIYLVTHDTNPDDISGTAVPMREIQASLTENLLADRVILLADTCHSAAVATVRGARSLDNTGLVNRYLQELSKTRPGIALMTSAEAEEVAREDATWGGGHGVFTYYLLQGMKGEADTGREDGVVTVGELFEYVREKVKEATKGQQHPSIGQTQFDRNLPMAVTGGTTAHELYRLGLGLYELGLMQDDPGRLRSAASQLREAVRLSRMNGAPLPDAEFYHGRTYLALGEPNGAVEALKGAAESETGTGHEANFFLGIALAKKGDVQGAEAQLRKYIQENPNDEKTRWLRELGGELGLNPQVKKHALLIGVGKFLNKNIESLKGPQNDLLLMSRLLVDRFGFVPSQVTRLEDAAATRDGIVRELERLQEQVSPGDLVCIYYSGHGQNLEPYIVAHDFDVKNSTGGISSDELHELLMSIPTWNKIVILDTHGNQRFIRLANGTKGYQALLASKPGQMAYERLVDGNPFGAFTRAFYEQVLLIPSEALTYGDLLDRISQTLQAKPKQEPVLVGNRNQHFLEAELPLLQMFDVTFRSNWEAMDPKGLTQIVKFIAQGAYKVMPWTRRSLARALLYHNMFREAKAVLNLAEASDLESALLLAPAEMGLENYEGSFEILQNALSSPQFTGQQDQTRELLLFAEDVATGKKPALLVGIEKFENANIKDLKGPREDLDAVRKFLINKCGARQEDIKILLDKDATRTQIMERFRELAAGSRVLPAVFYFSGVCSRTKSAGFTIVASDSRLPGVFDIDLKELVEVAGKNRSNVLSIFDCSWSESGDRWIEADVREKPVERGVGVPLWSYEGFPTVGRVTIAPAGTYWGLEEEQDHTSFTQKLIAQLKQSEKPQLKSEDIVSLTRAWWKGKGAFVSNDADVRSMNIGPDLYLWNKIKLLLDTPRLKESIAILARSIERRNGLYPEGLLNLGIAYDALGQDIKSIEALERAVIQGDETLTTEARYHLGRVLYKSQTNLPRAVDELRRATQADPGNIKAYFYLGQAIRALVDQDLLLEAEQALQTYVDAGAPLDQRDKVQMFFASLAPKIISLRAAPPLIQEGHASTLTWETHNATSVFISNIGEVRASGSRIVEPKETTTYELTARNSSRHATKRSIQVTVMLPP